MLDRLAQMPPHNPKQAGNLQYMVYCRLRLSVGHAQSIIAWIYLFIFPPGASSSAK